MTHPGDDLNAVPIATLYQITKSMNPQDAIDLSREAIKTCMMVGGPILMISLLIGLLVGVFQAMTQVQDQTVSFVPKILLLIVAIGACLPWLTEQMTDFARLSFERPFVQSSYFVPSTAPLVRSSPRLSAVPAEPASFSSSIQRPQRSPPMSQAKPDSEKLSDGPSWTMPNSQSANPRDEPDLKSPFILPHYRYSRGLKTDVGG